MDTNIVQRPRRRHIGCHFASALILGLALAATGASWPGRVAGIVSAQEVNPCALLSDEALKPFAASATVAAGVSNSLPAFGRTTCQFAWGNGVDRSKLVVVVSDASRVFPDMTPDQIKQRLLASVRPDTDDAVIPEVGDAAVFKPESFVYAIATALVKGRILQVQLDGLDAVDKKNQVIELLKSAASRL